MDFIENFRMIVSKFIEGLTRESCRNFFRGFCITSFGGSGRNFFTIFYRSSYTDSYRISFRYSSTYYPKNLSDISSKHYSNKLLHGFLKELIQKYFLGVSTEISLEISYLCINPGNITGFFQLY